MRKRIGPVPVVTMPAGSTWLGVALVAEVEVSSEEPGFPIEAALEPGQGPGWRAADQGLQSIRLPFNRPRPIRRIWLRFEEATSTRTRELVLQWSADGGRSFREVVRQQWTFSPTGTAVETESYQMELEEVTPLALTIMPDISGGPARASVAAWLLA